jgi:large subunit ribosomal protein L25
MEKIQLKSVHRTEIGKNAMKRIRNEKKIPAIYYDSKRVSIPLTLELQDVIPIIHREDVKNVLIELQILDGKSKKYNTVIKDIQYHPVRGNCLHIDFHEISLRKKLEMGIHVVFTGEAKGVKEGGILDIILREVEIRGLLQNVPEHLEIDVASLDIGNSVHVSDLAIPEGLEILTDPERTLATILPPKTIQKPEAEEEAEEEAAVEGEEEQEDAEESK